MFRQTSNKSAKCTTNFIRSYTTKFVPQSAQINYSTSNSCTAAEFNVFFKSQQQKQRLQLAKTSQKCISPFTTPSAAYSTSTFSKQFLKPIPSISFQKNNYFGKYGVVTAAAAVCPVNHGQTVAKDYKYDIQADAAYVAKMKKQEGALYKALEAIIESNDTYDGYGNYGPLLIRLSWHASGTFDQSSKTGGSNGACLRFSPESSHGANNGLDIARNLLENIKKQFPDISYADLYTFAGKVAAEYLGGPTIPFRFGRSDYTKDAHFEVDTVRLPDATQGADHVRRVFTSQMGFTDREIVALLGCHSIGKMHLERSGFSSSVDKGVALPWTYAPTVLGNHYYTTLLEEKWTPIPNPNNNDVVQFENEKRDLIMLPAEYTLVVDNDFRPFVELYAKDDEAWRQDFASAYSKLLELGVTFPQ